MNTSNNYTLVYGISPNQRPSSSDATCIVRNVISAPESYWTDAIYAWQKGLVTITNSDHITVDNAYYLLEQATGNEKGTSVNRETLVAGVPLSGFKPSVWRFEAGKLPSLKALAKTYRIGIPVEGGRMSLLVDEGETASFEITADKGWSLNALYVDYTDCTAYMQGNRYILTNVSRNHTVSAVFEQSPEVGIQTQKAAQQPRLVVNPDRSLAFESLKGQQWLHIYDVSGKLLMQRHVDANSRIRLEQGIYIVKVGYHTYKINL